MDFAQPLRESDVDPDPLRQFLRWRREAQDGGVRAPEAAALATASTAGEPSVRIVLVKHAAPDGLRFFTNLESLKGRQLAENPRAELLFFWDPLGRQIRVHGEVARVPPEVDEQYVRQRPRGSQLSALASPQSQVVPGRDQLERRVAALSERYGDGELPLPANWGGFCLLPRSYEFWQHRADRLHDRLLYTRQEPGSWRLQRLAP